VAPEPEPPSPPAFGLAPTPGGGWVPVPDPTALTTAQLRRELATLRELVEAQISTASAALTARLDAMDEANGLRLDGMREVPAVIREQIAHLKELHDEKFSSIALQFAERDTRTEQAAKASKEALDAALLAAKELVSQQNEANSATADKAEQSTIKQIDQIGIRIDTMQKALDDRITEIKERIDRGEGGTQGVAAGRTERRLDYGQVIAVLAVLAAVAAVIISAFHP
jgi:hypothetical protein